MAHLSSERFVITDVDDDALTELVAKVAEDGVPVGEALNEALAAYLKPPKPAPKPKAAKPKAAAKKGK